MSNAFSKQLRGSICIQWFDNEVLLKKSLTYFLTTQVLHIITHLILTMILQAGYYYYANFTNKETESQTYLATWFSWALTVDGLQILNHYSKPPQ